MSKVVHYATDAINARDAINATSTEKRNLYIRNTHTSFFFAVRYITTSHNAHLQKRTIAKFYHHSIT